MHVSMHVFYFIIYRVQPSKATYIYLKSMYYIVYGIEYAIKLWKSMYLSLSNFLSLLYRYSPLLCSIIPNIIYILSSVQSQIFTRFAESYNEIKIEFTVDINQKTPIHINIFSNINSRVCLKKTSETYSHSGFFDVRNIRMPQDMTYSLHSQHVNIKN